MSALDPTARRRIGPLSVRRQVNRKILRFSLAIGLVAAVLTAIVHITSVYPSVREWKDINVRTLSDIACSGVACDTSKVSTRWDSDSADYVIDAQTRYFMFVPASSAAGWERFRQLDYSDTAFIVKFRQPTSYNSLDGEVWRLYSQEANVGGQKFEIIVGYAEKAPWKMIDTTASATGIVDEKLKREANGIAASLPSLREGVRGGRSGFSADGYAVVDVGTREVVEVSWLPMFLPEGKRLPNPGWQLYVNHGELYVVLTDTNGRVVATSLVPVGRLWWLGVLVALAFMSVAIIVRALGMQFLRGYFVMAGRKFPRLEEALQTGENECVEFKRGFREEGERTGEVEDELLRSIAAFANTNGGAVFVGIDDAGHVRGLPWDSTQKDRFDRKVHQLVRSRIRPRPPIEIAFDEVRGLLIGRIMVARGEAVAYMMGGVIYVRDGSADVQAQPEDLARLIVEYAT